MSEPAAETFGFRRLTMTATVPTRAHPKDAGLDLCADLYKRDGAERVAGGILCLTVPPGQRRRIPTGLAITPPEGTFAHLLDKSGLADRYGITILGGVCDEGYTGEYQVIVLNTGNEPWHVIHGVKLCQIVFQRISYAVGEERELPQTARGAKGFGSTGAMG
ncbi:Deoxyuridine 5'-triphosphate nucleotidohydrolase (plasmid) [Rhodovastum atsumiense]|uniref:dUTP diphosphatase n=1 Tax=Rhodovastum atsumiense TaxID=504468 RepID=A0A5M6ITI0_9PROT|nr:dUTP diphosphatase [Rhodovastum atsumiense]KAA5611620.1 dUTP diphosphatase [Rhodovastum atsumiense]CAH2606293.1 Deoxyuridine 5'-triphosphate nucleotidohydrolase [Rhodovastum atsumiense]